MGFKHWIGSFFGGSEKRFYRSSSSTIIGQKGAIYLNIDADQAYIIFNENPQVNQVIRKKSAMFANMVLKLVDKDGKEIEAPDLKKLLENPNPLQSQNEFLRQYIEQKDVYGNQFIYKSRASKAQKFPSSLSHMSPRHVKPVATGKLYDQFEMSGIIAEYRVMLGGKEQPYNVEDVLWSRITDLDDPLVGVSPLKSLRYPITNSKYAYDYLNVISNEKGAIGILSNGTKDSVGHIPLTTEERQKLESAYVNNYGIGEDSSGRSKMRTILTDADIKYTPMTYPTGDLLLLEQIGENFLTVIDHFGLNVNIFSSKSQTFENVKAALKQCYEDTIFVEADQFTQALSKFIGLPEGQRLVADYSHLQILKADGLLESQSLANISAALAQLVASLVLTKEEAKQIIINTFKYDLSGVQSVSE